MKPSESGRVRLAHVELSEELPGLLPQVCDRAILSATLFLIIFAPLAYGAVDPWAQTLIRIVVAVMLVCWLLKCAYLRNLRITPLPFWLPAVLFLLLLIVQLAPMPFWLRVALSPEPLRHSILLPDSPQQALGVFSNWTQLTIYPKVTWEGLLDFVTCLALCFVLVNNLKSSQSIRFVTTALLVVGSFEAAYGLVEFWSGRQGIFWFSKLHYREEVTGTYINHNHFAGLVAMLMPLGVGMVWQRLALPPSQQAAPRAGWRRPDWHLGLAAAALGVMLAGLLLSFSRGGLIACALATVWLVVSLVRRHPVMRQRKRAALGLVVMLSCIVLIFSREIVTRFSYTVRDAPERFGLWVDGWKIVRDFKWFGTGMGTFKYVLPNYRSKLDFLAVDGVSRQVIWNFAHNDYLQLLIECGVLGFGMALWAAYETMEKLWQWRREQSGEVAILASSALAGVAAMLIHSLVDFNLHIPANALIFSILLSLALATSRPGVFSKHWDD